MQKSKRIWCFIKDMVFRFQNDDLLSTGAQAAFYLLLSLFPFLIFLITLLSYTPMLNLKENVSLLANIMPDNAYRVIKDMISQAIINRSNTFLSFGMLITIWSSTSGVSALIRGFNRAYDQKETRPFWKILLVSVLFTLELAIVIIFSLSLIIFGKMLGMSLFELLGFSEVGLMLWNSFRLILAFLTIILVFISLYKSTPSRSISFKEAIPGAIFASFGWFMTSFVFSYYVNNFNNYSNLYGNLGGIIALLTWIYLSTVIILLGAEINASFSFHRIGRKKEKHIRY